MTRINLDFAPGLHGHFLELVLNKYIYEVPFNGTVFQSTGAVHAINVEKEYQANKIVYAGHYSTFGTPVGKDVDKLIFINHCASLDFVLLTNIYYRCHPDTVLVKDFDVAVINTFHEEQMHQSQGISFKNQWFARLSERTFQTALIKNQNLKFPTYYFDFKSFFSLPDFCIELQKTAHFLEQTFKFDQSLGNLWQEFMDKNQGWKLYQQAESILTATLTGHNESIPKDWKLHAYLNFRLSKIFDIYDGIMYYDDTYPTTTDDLLQIVQEHISNFDNRW